MTGPPPVRPVCLIGPPASGKTTLAEALGQGLNAPILRPRDLVGRTVDRYPASVGLFPRDAQGRVPDESLGFALRVSLDALRGLVILENLPWDSIQLADLFHVARDRLILVHLNASDDLVTTRRTGRRYCARCYPRPQSSQDGLTCTRCGSTLATRPDDAHSAFLERLGTHRNNTATMLVLARKLGIPLVTLQAALRAEELAAAAMKII